MTDIKTLNARVSAAKAAVEARGETFYPGPSRVHLASFPPKERWDDWVELDSKSWPKRVEKRYALVPTTCFNCESACGLLAYVDKDTLEIRKFEGNPEHPGSRGRNCAKGPATLNQVTDPDRILYPLKRQGKRGEGKWTRVSWDEALDDLAGRIRKAISEKRPNDVMYHVGRPGEDGYTERVLAAWGVDGHNSHTNICSSGARAGYAFWMGLDRPSPDHANAKVIFLISAHLESGHYFNPHAQRIIEGKQNGAKLIVVDTRLSNTATHADHWLAPVPGSEAAMLLAIANHLIQKKKYDRAYVERWWNWQEYLHHEHPNGPQTFEAFEKILATLYTEWSFERAAKESGVDASVLKEVADIVSTAGSRLSTHNWRSAGAANLGGWQVARTLFLLNALMGAVATEGGTHPNAWNKFVPKPIHTPPHPDTWNELTWPQEFPLALNEMSFLLPHLLKEGRGKLDVYFTRVYNPVWTNPDGFTWIEALTDESKVGLHAALTPTWSETAYFADYVLPMGLGSERHDTSSYEQYDGQWVGFRQPVMRAAKRKMDQDESGSWKGAAGSAAAANGRNSAFTDTRATNPGEVWEENEFWIELSWRIDPDGSMGIRKHFESRKTPGEKLGVDEYYSWMFDNSLPGLPEKAAAEGLTPIEYMRRYGVYEVSSKVGALHEQPVPEGELEDAGVNAFGRVYTRTPRVAGPNIVPIPSPDPDAQGRRPVGVEIDGKVLRGFPTPSGKLKFYSRTLIDWGWPEYALPTYIRSHVHPESMAPDQKVLISTFRLPVQIHTRSANAKWLDEIAHTNPLWLHTTDAKALGDVQTGELLRVETEIGHFVVKAWVTEGIRPGVVACSHHMGRWKLQGGVEGQRSMMATVDLERDGARGARGGAADNGAAAGAEGSVKNGTTGGGSQWALKQKKSVAPFESSDPDTMRMWWTEVGVHQNLTFPVHPDPISGAHCWHQAVRVTRAKPGDRAGEIFVDTEKSHRVYHEWLELARSAKTHSPDGTRRPYWLLRPLKPSKEAYKLGGPTGK